MESYIAKQVINNLGPFHMHMDHLHYVVDDDTRKVTAYAEVYVSFPSEIYQYLHFQKLPAGLHPYSAISVEASAVCAPEDSFNVDLGKKIAKIRLEEKAYYKLSNNLITWTNELRGFINKVSERTIEFTKCANKVIKEDDAFLEKLTQDISTDTQEVNPQIS